MIMINVQDASIRMTPTNGADAILSFKHVFILLICDSVPTLQIALAKCERTNVWVGLIPAFNTLAIAAGLTFPKRITCGC